MLNIAVCDDSRTDVEMLESAFDKLAQYQFSYEVYFTAKELLKHVIDDGEMYHLYIFDIEMPEMNGLQLAKEIRKIDAKALFVFLTGYTQYVMDVFEVITFDYISKPITVEKLESVLLKAMQYLHMIKRDFVFQFRKNQFRISCDDIVYFEKKGRQAVIHTISENFKANMTTEEIWKQLDDKVFAHIHVSYTKFDISQITSYNSNLNKRLSRKDPKYKSRNEQLDLVIVVDRLLTGFDAPCMSTIFIDRQPMGPHDLIQAFSRTNRIFDKKSKPYGQIVTFQAPVLFKKCVDDAVKLYSAGSTEDTPLIAEWDDVEPAFKKALAALRIAAQTPDVIPSMSDEEKFHFMKMFQSFDRLFAQLKSFSRYDESMLDDYGITEQEYIDYAGHYLNIKSEIGPDPGPDPDPVNPPVELEIDSDYELMAYSNTRIDYEYIINLIQNIVNPEEDGDITPEEKQKKIDEAKQYVEDLRKDNPKVADIMSHLINDIELDESRFKGKSILNIVENMKHECIEQVVSNFCLLWHADKDDVMYAATHYRNGIIPNESAIKASINYPEYKNTVEHALPKFKYYTKFFAELRSTLDDEIKPLV